MWETRLTEIARQLSPVIAAADGEYTLMMYNSTGIDQSLFTKKQLTKLKPNRKPKQCLPHKRQYKK